MEFAPIEYKGYKIALHYDEDLILPYMVEITDMDGNITHLENEPIKNAAISQAKNYIDQELNDKK